MAFSADQLANNPHFIIVLGHLARGLRGVYDESPRLARTLASHQRWLLSQAAYALHIEYDPRDPSTGLTGGRLKEFITRTGAASRNTVLNFLEEMLTYRFVKYVESERHKRSRRLVATDVTDVGMMRWFGANLMALDQLDGGDRAAAVAANPAIFRLAQPRAARACIENDGWREPPARVATFLWTEAGGLVMDELVARADLSKQIDGRMNIGRVDARAMAEHFMMSRTHLQRLFKKAANAGCLGWYGEKRAGEMWFSSDFLLEYSSWQAIKFSIVDHAFQSARAELEPVAAIAIASNKIAS